MALLLCPDCSREVSSRAPACPGCGCPIAAPATVPAGPAVPVQTIEQTGKGWKFWQLAGGVMTFGGLAGAVLKSGSESNVAVGIAVLGLAVFILARLGAWWEHG